jgi:antitoxin component YwqK of YwqJK toxin-antitoxin module
MRLYILLLTLLITLKCYSQKTLDSPFIKERHLINQEGDLVHFINVPQFYSSSKYNEYRSCNFESYTLEEPYYWVTRKYLKISLEENPFLDSLNSPDGIRSINEVFSNAIKRDYITIYKDVARNKPFSPIESKEINPEFDNLEIYADFYYDYDQNEIHQLILSCTAYKTDSLVFSTYFPETKWLFQNYEINTAELELTLDSFFNDWFFLGRNVSKNRAHNHTLNPIHQEQLEFNALINNYLIDKELRNRTLQYSKNQTNLITSTHSYSLKIESTIISDTTKLELKKGNKTLISFCIVDGVVEGQYKEMYLNGVTKDIGLFSNGLRIGNWQSFYENGERLSIRNYKSGILDGAQNVFYSNGNTKCSYSMSKGEYEGFQICYYENGSHRFSGNLKDGFVTGKWKYSVTIPSELKDLIIKEKEHHSISIHDLDNNFLDYNINYTYQRKNSECVLGRCVSMAFSLP